MMEEIRDVFEVFNLNDISSNDGIDFNFPLPLDSEGEEDDDQPEMVKDANVDPFQFMLPRVYCFKLELGEYLIQCLRPGGVDITSPDVTIGLDGAFFPQQEGVALGDFHKQVVKKWERFKKGFGIIRMEGEDRLFNQKHPTLIVPYIDEWASIIQRAHCEDGTHVPELKILSNIGNHNWLVGGNNHGIPKPYITEVIKTCRECNFGQPRNVRKGGGMNNVEFDNFGNTLKCLLYLGPMKKNSSILLTPKGPR
jgi:hypothetical protein